MRPYHAQDWDTINIDWFSNKREDNIPLPEYRLNFIWAVRCRFVAACALDRVLMHAEAQPQCHQQVPGVGSGSFEIKQPFFSLQLTCLGSLLAVTHCRRGTSLFPLTRCTQE